MRRLFLTVPCIFLAVAGCAAPVPTPPPPMVVLPPAVPSPPLPPAPGEYFDASGQWIAGRQFLKASESFKITRAKDRPRAYVVLDSSDLGDNQKICEAFIKLPLTPVLEDAGYEEEVVTTWWPLATDSPVQQNCNWLVANYDYDRANTIRSIYSVPDASKQSIVAVDPLNRSFLIDLTMANNNQRSQTMRTWFEEAQKTAPDSAWTAIVSNNFFDRLGHSLQELLVQIKALPEILLCSAAGGEQTAGVSQVAEPTFRTGRILGDIADLGFQLLAPMTGEMLNKVCRAEDAAATDEG